MDALIFGFKFLTIGEATNMSLADIGAWYDRAVAWLERNKPKKGKR